MIAIELNSLVPTLLARFGSPAVLETILDHTAAGARAQWIRVARQRLGSSRHDYIRGIQEVEREEGARVISLVGWLANAIEQGLPSFDMRTTLLSGKSRLTKVGKDGKRYGHVPFRHGTPASGGGGGTPMGRAYGPVGDDSRGVGGVVGSDDAKSMGARVYAAAKTLSATKTHTYTSARSRGSITETKWGGRLQEGLAPKLHERHATDIFSGMVRERHTYDRATQTKFMTWRTISERTGTGWIHPGITARHLASSVEEWVGEHAGKIVANAILQVTGIKL